MQPLPWEQNIETTLNLFLPVNKQLAKLFHNSRQAKVRAARQEFPWIEKKGPF